MGKKLPERWLPYTDIGNRIEGTNIVNFKVPLDISLVRHLPENKRFTPQVLQRMIPNLKMVIDLTMSTRYYDPEDFLQKGIDHAKIYVEGKGTLPPPGQLEEFYRHVDAFQAKYGHDPDALLGVHCTHGLNRTGFFVCSYMIQKLNMAPSVAIQRFETARGHAMERQTLIDKLNSLGPTTLNNSTDVRTNSSNTNNTAPNSDYRSPLENCYEYEKLQCSSSRRRIRNYRRQNK